LAGPGGGPDGPLATGRSPGCGGDGGTGLPGACPDDGPGRGLSCFDGSPDGLAGGVFFVGADGASGRF
jgi:hypothetical protein